MDPGAFTDLLTGGLSTVLRWQRGHRCPCLDDNGGVNPECAACGGWGTLYDEWSDEFRAGVTSVTAKAMENIIQRWGPGMKGAATLSLPYGSAPYADIGPDDRLVVVDDSIRDTVEWSLTAGHAVALCPGTEIVSAHVLNSTKTSRVAVPVPTVDADGRITVTISTVVMLRIPRRFEVSADLPQVRGWAVGLPKKVTVRLVDVSARW
jgi:hypothetical protein